MLLNSPPSKKKCNSGKAACVMLLKVSRYSKIQLMNTGILRWSTFCSITESALPNVLSQKYKANGIKTVSKLTCKHK